MLRTAYGRGSNLADRQSYSGPPKYPTFQRDSEFEPRFTFRLKHVSTMPTRQLASKSK